jgi:hypothetical protein
MTVDYLVLLIDPLLEDSLQGRMLWQDKTLDIAVKVTVEIVPILQVFVPVLLFD